MSKYGGRAGHNEKCRGAKAILDEVIENRKIFSWSKFYLDKKNNFTDCTPYHNPIKQTDDLNYAINIANQNKVDLFYSVHLNKAYEKFDGEIGAEVWVYDRNSTKAIEAATRILSNLEALGFKNRGIKYMKEEKKQLGELMYTNCNALIVECFFLEATKDVEVYNRVGAEAIGFAIATGINPSITKKTNKNYFIVTDYIPQEPYGLEINSFKEKYLYDISRIYLRSNPRGLWIETQYLPKEKCEELKKRLGNLFWEIKEH